MHMAFRDFFRELGPLKTVRSVKVAGDKVLAVKGFGTIDIRANVNDKVEDRQLTNVLYVPDLKRNLFSVGAITDRGFSFHSYQNRCEVRDDNGNLSAQWARYGHLFRMLFEVRRPEECNIAQENSLKLWHERLGHINVTSVKETKEAGAVDGMKIQNESEFFCEVCVIGKQVQKSHHSNKREKISAPGEMIHSDVCGPVNVESPRGSRYFVLFKDDCTGFLTVYFMCHKDEVLGKFKEYEAMIEKQTGNQIKILRPWKRILIEGVQGVLTRKGNYTREIDSVRSPTEWPSRTGVANTHR